MPDIVPQPDGFPLKVASRANAGQLYSSPPQATASPLGLNAGGASDPQGRMRVSPARSDANDCGPGVGLGSIDAVEGAGGVASAEAVGGIDAAGTRPVQAVSSRIQATTTAVRAKRRRRWSFGTG